MELLQTEIIYDQPSKEHYRVLKSLYSEIFTDADEGFFDQRFREKERFLTLVTFCKGKPVGFKIGYLYDEDTFYSWLGGVLPAFRKMGIADMLLRKQHALAKKMGFSRIRAKSMNRFKPMMILNLRSGFNITRVYTNATGQQKIVFEKEL